MIHTPSFPALSIQNLDKWYGTYHAVCHVSFEIHQGEIFGLLGPNGTGKTTILSIIATLQNLTKGSVKIFGIDLLKNPSQAKSLIGFVPQELVNHGFFNVTEILRYHATYYGIKLDPSYLRELLEKLHLTQHQYRSVKRGQL